MYVALSLEKLRVGHFQTKVNMAGRQTRIVCDTCDDICLTAGFVVVVVVI